MQTNTPLIADELAGLFHMAAEDSHGCSPSHRCVRTLAGAVLTDPDEVQQDVLTFHEAIFQSHHAAVVGAEAPVDSGVCFSPDEFGLTHFLPGLPAFC